MKWVRVSARPADQWHLRSWGRTHAIVRYHDGWVAEVEGHIYGERQDDILAAQNIAHENLPRATAWSVDDKIFAAFLLTMGFLASACALQIGLGWTWLRPLEILSGVLLLFLGITLARG